MLPTNLPLSFTHDDISITLENEENRTLVLSVERNSIKKTISYFLDKDGKIDNENIKSNLTTCINYIEKRDIQGLIDFFSKKNGYSDKQIFNTLSKIDDLIDPTQIEKLENTTQKLILALGKTSKFNQKVDSNASLVERLENSIKQLEKASSEDSISEDSIDEKKEEARPKIEGTQRSSDNEIKTFAFGGI